MAVRHGWQWDTAAVGLRGVHADRDPAGRSDDQPDDQHGRTDETRSAGAWDGQGLHRENASGSVAPWR